MNIARSTFYRGRKTRDPDGMKAEADLVDRIEAICLEFPRYGYRRVAEQLKREKRLVNHKRVLRLMRESDGVNYCFPCISPLAAKLDAFSAWVIEVEYVSELVIGLAVLEADTSGDFNSKVRDARQVVKETKRAKSDVWLSLRLLALTVACDLLVLGIEEQRPCATWALEVEKIRKLRSDIVLASMNELPQDSWLAGTNKPNALAKSLWDGDEPVKEKTIALLKALERLQIAQNNVRYKVKALEHSLSS